MEPGFFIKLAESTSDGFAYYVLPSKEYKDIPITRIPFILVRCMVRSRYMSSSIVTMCHREDNEFKFFNSKGDEIFGEEELMTAAELEAMSGVSGKEVGLTPNSRSNGNTILTSPSLTSLDMDLSTIIEEAHTYEEAVVTTLEETEGEARSTTTPLFTPTDDGPPHVPMVS